MNSIMVVTFAFVGVLEECWLNFTFGRDPVGAPSA
jgi:hypothetical protein